MQIEIVEFYPADDFEVPFDTGTLHVYLIEQQIDLRGICVHYRKGRWFFNLPFFTGIDDETKEEVRYPVFSFTDREKHKLFVEEVKKKGLEYILKNFVHNKEITKKVFKRLGKKAVIKKPYVKKEFPKKDFKKKCHTK